MIVFINSIYKKQFLFGIIIIIIIIIIIDLEYEIGPHV